MSSARTQRSYRARRELLRGQPCSVPGCPKVVRGNLARYCKSHSTKSRLLGDPTLRGLRPHEYAKDRRDLERLLLIHRDHPGVQAGQRLLRDLLAACEAQHTGLPAADELARIVRYGADTREWLALIFAAWIAIDAQPHRFKIDLSVTKALGRAGLGIAPRVKKKHGTCGKAWREIGGQARREFGIWIRENLAPLYVNVRQALHEARTMKDKDRELMFQPIAIDRPDVGRAGGTDT